MRPSHRAVKTRLRPRSDADALASLSSAMFEVVVPCRTSGTQGLTVRVLPRHEDLGHPHETGLIVWAS
jgi:hypothetical protein